MCCGCGGALTGYIARGSLADPLPSFVGQAEGHFFEEPSCLKTGRYAKDAVAQRVYIVTLSSLLGGSSIVWRSKRLHLQASKTIEDFGTLPVESV